MKIKNRSDVYNQIRQFHKNILHVILDIVEKEDLDHSKKFDYEDHEALETISGVLYLSEKVFARQ